MNINNEIKKLIMTLVNPDMRHFTMLIETEKNYNVRFSVDLEDKPLEIRPPENAKGFEWHFLYSDKASFCVISQWINELWYSTGEKDPITPREMAKRGWKYYGAVTLPDHFEI